MSASLSASTVASISAAAAASIPHLMFQVTILSVSAARATGASVGGAAMQGPGVVG
jgi:hypothetical protein